MGEVLGSSGQEMTTAFVAGYEVWCELWRRSKHYHKAGWHPTSVFGALASAAACSVLHRLSAHQASMALAIAAATEKGATTVVGGGDTATAAKQLGVTDRITHLSTGGGASLELLEGKTLPGVAVLNDA